jgi:hypothetical protein
VIGIGSGPVLLESVRSGRRLCPRAFVRFQAFLLLIGGCGSLVLPLLAACGVSLSFTKVHFWLGITGLVSALALLVLSMVRLCSRVRQSTVRISSRSDSDEEEAAVVAVEIRWGKFLIEALEMSIGPALWLNFASSWSSGFLRDFLGVSEIQFGQLQVLLMVGPLAGLFVFGNQSSDHHCTLLTLELGVVSTVLSFVGMISYRSVPVVIMAFIGFGFCAVGGLPLGISGFDVGCQHNDIHLLFVAIMIHGLVFLLQLIGSQVINTMDPKLEALQSRELGCAVFVPSLVLAVLAVGLRMALNGFPRETELRIEREGSIGELMDMDGNADGTG